MDLIYWPRKDPLRVMMVNPLTSSSQIAITKILSGVAFGLDQLIDMTLLVYSNEIPKANGFIQELIACNFGCLYSVVATSDLPSISDADIFCFNSTFKNPSILDDNLESNENFDSIYLTLKVALSIAKSCPVRENTQKEETESEKKYPLIIGDGLVTMDMVYSMANIDIPSSCFFSGDTTACLAKGFLSDLLQVYCNEINRVYVWGVNDRTFHVEIEKPFVTYDKIRERDYCDWEMVSKELLEPLKLDQTKFNPSWMKKEFIEKLQNIASRNPYGDIYRGWILARCLNKVWMSIKTGQEFGVSLGVISDGSLRTTKGLPYILPVIFEENSTKWQVDTRFIELPHVKQEIYKFNKVAKANHKKLVKYCTKFIAENIIQQSFIPPDSEDVSTFSGSGSTI